MKTYTSKSEISLSIRLDGNAHMHVRFNPTSNGGSMYITSNPAVQKGLERHKQFGKMFNLVEDKTEPKKVEPKKVEQKTTEKTIVNVRSVQDAKDYLVETFGILRTQLNSKAKILAQAESHNIEFNGLN